MTISFKLTSSGSGTQIAVTNPTYVDTNWTKVSGTLTPTWSGALTEARWRTFTYPAGGTMDYCIDDAVMKIPNNADLKVVSGSRRREVMP